MNLSLFLVSLLIALVGPLLAVTYLKPILLSVLNELCGSHHAAEFWLRSAYLLALCGTVLLMLSFGEFSDHSTAVDTVRRSLWLVFAGVFLTVAMIARNVWRQIQPLLQPPVARATTRIADPAAPADTAMHTRT